MKNNEKILVVGTTSDYIDWLRRTGEGRGLFLTDPQVRRQAKEPAPEAKEEILCGLTDVGLIRMALRDHLSQWNMILSGITCFDCESLGLAAFLAEDLDLSFPSVESVRICRDKYTTSSRWLKRSVRTPRFMLGRTPYDAADFREKIGRPCVLKPVSGSGSELVFRCETVNGCQRTARTLLQGIQERKENRLYKAATDCFLIEEFIEGVEYSCDFALQNKQVEIIRLTRKVKAPSAPFGTTMAYIPTTCEAEGLPPLEGLLAKAAQALGLSRALCMVDFLFSGDEVVFLELTPRPGGDCLPHLLQYAAGLDMLKLALDFAGRTGLDLPGPAAAVGSVGLRLHADRAGRIKEISTELLEKDPRVKSIHLIRQNGHLVILPPEEYESWYLGHVLFTPDPLSDVEGQCEELARLLVVDIEASEP
ncbi:MAG: ATP-grasp domain-containing protein [Desulfocapsaceae bacterium]|nr:ATP-grasp domain-containing protein [Desulfocapsaceae bacterium]